MSCEEVSVEVSLSSRDQAWLKAKVDGGVLSEVKIKAIGCLGFLKKIDQAREELEGATLEKLELIAGVDHSSMLIRELFMKLKGDWEFPYEHAELCHCRVISTEAVDNAVLNGASSTEEVAQRTSAGTGCGTCQKDTQKIIDYRRT